MNRMKFHKDGNEVYIKVTQTHRIINTQRVPHRPLTRREAFQLARVGKLTRDSRRS